MQFKGKIIETLPVVTGQGARGQWVKQGFVLEYESGQYPKSIAFDVFGEERIKQFNIQQGEELTVRFDFDAHEYNGRWFNQIRAFNVEKSGLQTQIVDVVMPHGATQAPQQHVPQQQNMFNAGEQNATPYQPTQQPQAADPDSLPF